MHMNHELCETYAKDVEVIKILCITNIAMSQRPFVFLLLRKVRSAHNTVIDAVSLNAPRQSTLS